MYTGEINEFINWSTGVDERTEEVIDGVSLDNKISGKSIRELITKHLKLPFVTIKDEFAGVTRVFSSAELAEEWWTYANPDQNNARYDLEKANSIKDKYQIWEIDLPATYAITGPETLGNTRYIIEGNSNSSNAVLSYTLGLRDALGGTDDDAISVTYTIKDSSENITYNEKFQYDTGLAITKSIYLYLRSGDNTVSISATANNHNARTTKTLHIYLVSFTIDSNFSGYYTGVSNTRNFNFDVTISRSITSLAIDTCVYISQVGLEMSQTPVKTWRYTESGATPSNNFDIPMIYSASDYENPRKYRMVITSSMEDPESLVSFNSNVLIYEFEVSANLGDLANAFVNCAYSVPSSNYSYVNDGTPILQATLYVPFTLDWGYYSDDGNQQSNIDWAIRTGEEGHYEYQELLSILGVKGLKPDSLTFISSRALNHFLDNSYLVAKIDNTTIAEYPITISENNIDVHETVNYSLKLSAYGKTNASETKDTWTDFDNNITTEFGSGVVFDNQNGWDNNSLILKGTNSYAIINYCPFPDTLNDETYVIDKDGCAFEIDFKPELVDSDNDAIITIGDISSNPNRGRIVITPNSAIFYDGSGSLVIKTNIKAGERVKLCFIFNKYSTFSSDSGLVYIVNNGILERASTMSNTAIKSLAGRIKIGGSRSTVRVYSIRAYRQSISPKEALDNYMFDNINDSALISRNDIYGESSKINYKGMLGKQDLIIIEGDLDNILHNAESKQNSTVKISRESNTDSSKDFTIVNCRIRNHGQSTLAYPITSMKIWFNKSNLFYENLGVRYELNPVLTCLSQSYLNLNKNRYIMKNGAIPSNKFVLQANYADSSGVHNGSLLRLINDTWYNAKFGDDEQFKLRTAPLLFTSGMKITHDNVDLGEDGSWVEGYYNIDPTDDNYDSTKAGLTWPEITGTLFPYNIRNAADSFPCTVFYRDTSSLNLELTLLGQYVFMDDKKSDYIYGERSIYCDFNDKGEITNSDDPFCLKISNKDKDTKGNRVWNNDKVLLVEVVYPNSPLTSYSEKSVADSYTLDENDNLIPAPGASHRFSDPYTTDGSGNVLSYYWEQHFELIYPDKEDITDKNNNFSSQKFIETVTPFMTYLEWITDVGALKNTGSKLGASGSQARVTQAELNKFIDEAHDHLDLYKLAAYYIFFLRFGLIDSVERNAQLKTYDGQHWHYEPWDMDIALGCANNGVIAYEPPLTRDTLAGGSTYAFSGRTAAQSNVLWDCLECWDYWANTLVPEVAQALYDAGLTYDNASKMFDEEYANKWSETLYNESGHYKYIDATNDPKYRLYLNGARTSHRHWWLSKSMNYYDAKWNCGDFTKHAILIRINKNEATSTGVLNHTVKIYPTSNTFFKMLYGSKGDSNITPIGGLTEASVTPGGEALINVNLQLDSKLPCIIFGASSIEELDVSELLSGTTNIGNGYVDINFGGSYDEILGAPIKRLKLGAKCTPDLYTNPNELSYTSNLSIGQNAIGGTTDDKKDALENLEVLDITGWYGVPGTQGQSTWISDLFTGNGYDRKNIKTLYAMGCASATLFNTSNSGNKFEELRLPTSINSLEFNNSSWEDISFWDTTLLSATKCRYDKVLGIPASITSIKFKGSSARNQCTLDMVLSWIDNIEAEIAAANPGYTSDELEEALLTALGSKVLYAEQINWGTGTTKLYYKDLIRLSSFGNEGDRYNLKGYVIISDLTPLTSTQLTQLQTLFGEYVFNVGTTNSNLVVDQNLGFVRISVLGERVNGVSTITTIGDEIYLSEPNRANLLATTFSLKANNASNIIINTDTTYSLFETNTPLNTYLWTISDTENNMYGLTNVYNSVRLEKTGLGGVRIKTNEGDFGNYSFYVNVYYYDLDEYNQYVLKHDSVKINIIGVTYPTGYSFQFTRTQPRQFLFNTDIAESIFGLRYALSNPTTEAYVLSGLNQLVEVSIIPTGTYNATLKTIRYYLYDIDDSSINTDWLDLSTLNTGDSTLNLLGFTDRVIGYTRDGTSGMVLLVNNVPPNTMRKFGLSIEITIGGKNAFTQNITFIVWNDNEVIISQNTADGRYNTVVALYNNNYSLSGWGRNIYKSDLLSLYGTLDFSPYKNLTNTLLTNKGDSIFLYTPNITGIILNNCTSIPLVSLATLALQINLVNIPKLQSLSLKGCSGLVGELDLTDNYLLASLDTRNDTTTNNNCSVGIKLVNSRATSVLLGSPTSIVIISPTVLGNSGTTFTIDSKTNLNSIELNEINTSNVHTFSIFNTILSAS